MPSQHDKTKRQANFRFTPAEYAVMEELIAELGLNDRHELIRALIAEKRSAIERPRRPRRKKQADPSP